MEALCFSDALRAKRPTLPTFGIAWNDPDHCTTDVFVAVAGECHPVELEDNGAGAIGVVGGFRAERIPLHPPQPFDGFAFSQQHPCTGVTVKHGRDGASGEAQQLHQKHIVNRISGKHLPYLGG